ncbi:protein kinase domain-containing protein [Streptomyces sp. enrichment culture]|uniref:protein kinase domain-containing protein n=1 Tax=Streptomyces sp. enrichment culture TaxID=1795815 RepID=UPI003F5562E6
MGEVRRAHDEKPGRPVALKVLLTRQRDATATARFRLEARTAGRLGHPHVVGVLDLDEHEGRLFLVMEPVEGGSLAQPLATSGPLPAPRVAGIAAQAASGPAAAHRQGIAHRDIKPANLLPDADGTVKTGDFGITRFLDDPAAALTTTGRTVGTSRHPAPERALGRPAQAASDVYALGCVLYQLLTQRPPFGPTPHSRCSISTSMPSRCRPGSSESAFHLLWRTTCWACRPSGPTSAPPRRKRRTGRVPAPGAGMPSRCRRKRRGVAGSPGTPPSSRPAPDLPPPLRTSPGARRSQRRAHGGTPRRTVPPPGPRGRSPARSSRSARTEGRPGRRRRPAQAPSCPSAAPPSKPGKRTRCSGPHSCRTAVRRQAVRRPDGPSRGWARPWSEALFDPLQAGTRWIRRRS